jgi:hypothetical protein
MTYLKIEYLKWVATLAIVSATVFRALGSHGFDLVLSLLGSLLWAFIAFTWRERALLLLNVFSAVVLLYGVFNYTT